MKKSIVIGFVLAMCLLALGLRESHHAKISDTLDREKLKNESLLAEKLSLQKQIFKNKKDLEKAIDQNLATDRERIRLVQMNSQNTRSVAWAEKRLMSSLRNNQRLHHVVDSLNLQLIVQEQRREQEKEMLRDSILYLQELSQTLSAELHGTPNQ